MGRHRHGGSAAMRNDAKANLPAATVVKGIEFTMTYPYAPCPPGMAG